MYNPLKPDEGPSPALDASVIQTNFADYATIFGTNHVPINDRNQGAHSQIILENQNSDPGITEKLAILYNKLAPSVSGNQPQLHAQIPKFLPTNLDTTNAPNIGMQLTCNTVNTSGPVYQSFLPGGYMLYCGVVNGVTLPIAVTVTLTPSPTKIITAIAETNLSSILSFYLSTEITSANTFVIRSLGTTTPYSFTWTAIAKS